jgi:hypothetical protein
MKVAAVWSTRYIYVLLSTYAINLHTTTIQQMVVTLFLSRFIPRLQWLGRFSKWETSIYWPHFYLGASNALTQTLRSAKLWIRPSRVGSYSFRVT